MSVSFLILAAAGAAVGTYDGPLRDAFSGKLCPLPTVGLVRDGTIEYPASEILNATPLVMGRCHARRLALRDANKRVRAATRKPRR
jgi:hypothetical protein